MEVRSRARVRTRTTSRESTCQGIEASEAIEAIRGYVSIECCGVPEHTIRIGHETRPRYLREIKSVGSRGQVRGRGGGPGQRPVVRVPLVFESGGDGVGRTRWRVFYNATHRASRLNCPKSESEAGNVPYCGWGQVLDTEGGLFDGETLLASPSPHSHAANRTDWNCMFFSSQPRPAAFSSRAASPPKRAGKGVFSLCLETIRARVSSAARSPRPRVGSRCTRARTSRRISRSKSTSARGPPPRSAAPRASLIHIYIYRSSL